MVFDFLKIRKEKNDTSEVITLLSQIKIASTKVEQITDLLASNVLSQTEKEKVKSIDNHAKERQIIIVLNKIWDSFQLNKDYEISSLYFKPDELKTLRELLMSDSKDNNNIKSILNILQDKEIVGKRSFYTNYLIRARIVEFQEICSFFKIKEDVINTAIINTLRASLIHEKEV